MILRFKFAILEKNEFEFKLATANFWLLLFWIWLKIIQT